MKLNPKQDAGLRKVVEGKNLYISGPGGVGKSVLVRRIKELFGDSTVFVAPTGIAALNIDGATIHSAFKFPLQFLDSRTVKRDPPEKMKTLFNKEGPVKRIVVDEISMTRADQFAAMDMQLRKARRINQPFGGLQVIVVGDFYQLPPVVNNQEKKIFFEEYDSIYSFGTESWSGTNFEYIELDQVMRQTDEAFINHLQNIRTKRDGYIESLEFINESAIKNTDDVTSEDPVYLTCTNKSAASYNAINFDDLDGPIFTKRASISGRFDSQPAPEYLDLKYGTKVIMTANTDDFVNGSTGYVIEEVGNKIRVVLDPSGSEVLVERYKWEQKEYTVTSNGLDVDVVGSYTQFPMKYGWAQTIHKAQGQTLPYGVIDLGRGAFSHGQTYVALSRLRSLEGMGIVTPIRPQDVIIDRQVTEFYANDCKGIGLF